MEIDDDDEDDEDEDDGSPDAILVPGRGIGPVIIGRSNAADVRAAFGSDCKVNRYGSGEIYALDYDYIDEEEYDPGRPAQRSRPSKFHFAFGLLAAIEVAADQRKVATPSGIRIDSTVAEVRSAFGEPTEVLSSGRITTYLFVDHGIAVDLDDSETVMGFTAFRPRV